MAAEPVGAEVEATVGAPGAADVSRSVSLRTMALEPWLDVGDPLAEAVVKTLRANRIPLAGPLPAIRRLAAGGDADCRAFLLDIDSPAPWADFERMAVGAAMMRRHFPQFTVALIHGGLMTTFASAEAAWTLARTGRLRRDVPRRLMESSALFFGVLDTDALRPGGSAWETCVHVRLMHTMLRLQLLKVGDWPFPGVPINALHTATGPVFFGALMLERVRGLGGYASPAEAEGYCLLWRHVTHLLGVPRELIGDTAAEQAVLDERILPLCFSPDDNSRELAGVLLSGLGGMRGLGVVPRAVHEVLARRMLGEQRADAMGIPHHRAGTRALACAAVGLKAYGWAQRIPLVARGMEVVGRRCLTWVMRPFHQPAPVGSLAGLRTQ